MEFFLDNRKHYQLLHHTEVLSNIYKTLAEVESLRPVLVFSENYIVACLLSIGW